MGAGAYELRAALQGLAQRIRTAPPSEAVKDAEERWRKGDLSYKFWAVQKDMAATLRSPGSLKKVLNCSRRIRKTSTVLTLLIELSLKKQGAQIRYVGPTQKMIRKIIHPLMRLLTMDCPEDLKPIWRSLDGAYYFPSTGSELHVAAANNDHEDDSRGTAADVCVVDEAQMIKRLRYLIDDVLMPQLITTGGPMWIILTPPKTPVHECRHYVEEAKAAGTYAEFDIYRSEYPPETIELFCKEAGGPDSTTWLREYMCQFVVDKNFAIIPEWSPATMTGVYVPEEIAKFYFRYVAMDISGGKRHKTLVLYALYDFKQAKLFVEDETEILAADTSTKVVAKTVREKEKALWADIRPALRIADNSNLILLRDLGKDEALHFIPTTKDTLDAMVNNVRLWVSTGRIVVNPRCAQLLGSLQYGVWDDHRKHWEESDVYGHFDALAALMYMLRWVDVVTNPVPANYGIAKDDFFVRDGSGASQNAQALRRAFLGGRK